MNASEFMNLSKAYQTMTCILVKNISTGDEDENSYIGNIKLKEVSKFLQEHQVIPCPNCNHTGIIYDPKTEDTKTCQDCKGNGGYFRENDVEFYI